MVMYWVRPVSRTILAWVGHVFGTAIALMLVVALWHYAFELPMPTIITYVFR